MNFQDWTPCEVHGHNFREGTCTDCGEPQDADDVIKPGDKVRIRAGYLKKHPKVADEVYTVHCDFSSSDEEKFILKAADGTFPWCVPAAELAAVE